jgi:regulator of sirC expression with transglutaminase-like and TPR domain
MHETLDDRVDPAVRDYPRALGTRPDEDIDLAETALQLALLRQPHTPLEPFRKLMAAIAERVAARAEEDGATSLVGRVEALRGVIAGEYGFTGDRANYDDLQNASLIRVLDRRKGLPITLCILYLHVARSLGWGAHGLAFPGHFLIALDGIGGRMVLDPFEDGALRETPDLRALVKQMQGPAAELEPEHYASASNRAILTRLQNNIRTRLVRLGQFADALLSAEAVTWFSPHDAGAWRDMGMIHAEMGNLRAAVMTLEESLTCDDRPSRRHVTAALIQKLRTRLN